MNRKPRRPCIREVHELVVGHFGINKDALLSRGRSRKLVIVRWLSMWLCSHYVAISHRQIAHGHERDHSTLLHGLRKINHIRRRASSKTAWARNAVIDLEAELQQRFTLATIKRHNKGLVIYERKTAQQQHDDGMRGLPPQLG